MKTSKHFFQGAVLNLQYFGGLILFPTDYAEIVDPTQGFNIKTNFPKMENKISKKAKSTKTRVIFWTKKATLIFFYSWLWKYKICYCIDWSLLGTTILKLCGVSHAVLRSSRVNWWHSGGPQWWQIHPWFMQTPEEKSNIFLQISHRKTDSGFKVAAQLYYETSHLLLSSFISSAFLSIWD